MSVNPKEDTVSQEPSPAELANLLREIRSCRICRDAPRGRPLPHEPRPVLQAGEGGAPLWICGQAPGTRVHASGRPFTDASGERLRHWLGIGEATFYDPAQVAVIPMGFCFPGQDAKGGDLPPRPECAAVWHGPLLSALPAPRLIVALGLYAQRHHLARAGRPNLIGKTLGETVERWETCLAETRIIPLPHPSWRNQAFARRNPWFEATLLPVLRAKVRVIIGPPTGGPDAEPDT